MSLHRSTTLMLLTAWLWMMTACAKWHPKPVAPIHRWTVPLDMPGGDDLCVEQFDRWTCIPLEDLRKLLASMGRA